MSPTRVKICGITRVEDALAATASGADAIGLVFYAPSPRSVSAEQAREIAQAVAPFVTVVGLFVDASREQIDQTLATVPVDCLQFHGDESAAFCESFGHPWMKALRMQPDMDLIAAAQPYSNGRALLLDSWAEGVPGGTGQTFDWTRARADLPRPLVLAGGLDADNVGEAIALLRPAAVDVSGGVESTPGVKDAIRIRQFISAVRNANEQLDGAVNDK